MAVDDARRTIVRWPLLVLPSFVSPVAKSADDGSAEVMAALGTRVRDLRLARDLTQEEAAAASGIDYKRWQRIEAGSVNCTIRTLVRVADALGVGFWDLTERPRRSKR